MADTPAALQLRLLETVVQVSAEKNSTLVLPFPVELLRFLERAGRPAAGQAAQPAVAQPAAAPPPKVEPVEQPPPVTPLPPPRQSDDTAQITTAEADGHGPQMLP